MMKAHDDSLEKHEDWIAITEDLLEAAEGALTEGLERREELGLPYSIFALSSLFGKILLISNAVFQLAERVQLVPEQILLRSVVEHFLRLQYIFNGWVKTKKDSRGKSFAVHLLVDEELQLTDAYRRRRELLGSHAPMEPVHALLERRVVKSDRPRKQVKSEAAAFGHKRIVETLWREMKMGDQPASSTLLADLLPRYSELSALVHGGPLADVLMSPFTDEVARQSQCEDDADTALSIVATSMLFQLVLLANIDQKYMSTLAIFRGQLNRHRLPGGGPANSPKPEEA